MGVREARRLGVVEAAVRGKITNGEGAEALGLSVRQFRRLKRRVEEQGARGVIHGNRGRPSARQLDPARRQRVVALLGGEVRLNDCHVRDLLGEQGVAVSADTVRRIRRSLGLAPKQRRRPPRHRRRRAREARRGALVLIDGSPFRWLGLAAAELTLVGTTKPLTVTVKKIGEAKDPWGGYRSGFETTFPIKRSDFGIKGVPGVGDDVSLTFAVELTKK